MAGTHSRNGKQKKLTRTIDRASASTLSPNSPADYIAYTRHRLGFLAQKQAVYGQKKISWLKFQKYIRVPQAADKLAKKIVGRVESRALVVIGSAKIAANSPMKGYVRTPHPKLMQALKRQPRVDVLEIDEFRTTKLCSDCFDPIKTSKSPHRFQFCPKCGM